LLHALWLTASIPPLPAADGLAGVIDGADLIGAEGYHLLIQNQLLERFYQQRYYHGITLLAKSCARAYDESFVCLRNISARLIIVDEFIHPLTHSGKNLWLCWKTNELRRHAKHIAYKIGRHALWPVARHRTDQQLHIRPRADRFVAGEISVYHAATAE